MTWKHRRLCWGDMETQKVVLGRHGDTGGCVGVLEVTENTLRVSSKSYEFFLIVLPGYFESLVRTDKGLWVCRDPGAHNLATVWFSVVIVF